MNSASEILHLAYATFGLSLILFLIALLKRRKIRKKSLLMRKLFNSVEIQEIGAEVITKKTERFKFLERLLGQTYSRKIREKLSRAGSIGDEFLTKTIRQKFAFMLVALIISSLLFASSGGYFRIFAITLLGFFIPDILLTNTIQKRSESIQGALPDAVEMLTMCVEAGLTFQQALGKVSQNQRTVISTEFARVMSEIQIGVSRSQALEEMAARLDQADVKKFVSAMHQVDRLGIPISTVLKEQVKELRGKSRDRAREQAQKVPVKILGPVMACFLPSVLIIVVTPVILEALSNF